MIDPQRRSRPLPDKPDYAASSLSTARRSLRSPLISEASTFAERLEVLDDVIDRQLPQAEALVLEAEGDLEPFRDELEHRAQL